MVELGESKRTDAILDAALELVAEMGYDRLTMDAVATRAKASKATIYRHWPGKPELVADAVRCATTAADIPDTGSLRGDLLSVAAAMAASMCSTDGATMIGLTTAASHDPEFAKVLRETMHESKRPLWDTLVARAVERGELPAGTPAASLLFEVAPSVAFLAVVIDGNALDEAWQRHLVDDILLPLLSAPR